MPPKGIQQQQAQQQQIVQVQGPFAFHMRYDGETNPYAFFDEFERALDAQGRSNDTDARKCALLAMALHSDSIAALAAEEHKNSLPANAPLLFAAMKQHLINSCWTFQMKAAECDGVHQLEMRDNESPRAFMTRFAVALAKANRARVAMNMPSLDPDGQEVAVLYHQKMPPYIRETLQNHITNSGQAGQLSYRQQGLV
jgi:hypothetical protein